MSSIGRALLGVGFGRNPMLRRTDRFEARATLLLLAVLLVFGPLVVKRGAQATYRDGLRTERDEASRVQVVALVLEDAGYPAGASAEGGRLTVPVRARWHAPGGAVRTGPLNVVGGTRAGRELTIWVDRAGDPVDPPRRHDQTVGRSWGSSALIVAALLVAFWLVRRLIRHAVDRVRAADWQAAWREVEPRWSGRVP
jgi:hypothetical protein